MCSVECSGSHILSAKSEVCGQGIKQVGFLKTKVAVGMLFNSSQNCLHYLFNWA